MQADTKARKDVEGTAEAIRSGRPGFARPRHHPHRKRQARRPDVRRSAARAPLAHNRQCHSRRHQWPARRRQVDPHRSAGIESHHGGPQGRRACCRSDLVQERWLNPRRQDPHGPAHHRDCRLHPPLACRRQPGRRDQDHARDHRSGRGSRLRRGAGRDGRRRPVRDRRRQYGRCFRGGGNARAPATSCRASSAACSSSPTSSPSTRPTATISSAPIARRSNTARACIFSPLAIRVGIRRC